MINFVYLVGHLELQQVDGETKSLHIPTTREFQVDLVLDTLNFQANSGLMALLNRSGAILNSAHGDIVEVDSFLSAVEAACIALFERMTDKCFKASEVFVLLKQHQLRRGHAWTTMLHKLGVNKSAASHIAR